jgi:hypothetical protein
VSIYSLLVAIPICYLLFPVCRMYLGSIDSQHTVLPAILIQKNRSKKLIDQILQTRKFSPRPVFLYGFLVVHHTVAVFSSPLLSVSLLLSLFSSTLYSSALLPLQEAFTIAVIEYRIVSSWRIKNQITSIYLAEIDALHAHVTKSRIRMRILDLVPGIYRAIQNFSYKN